MKTGTLPAENLPIVLSALIRVAAAFSIWLRQAVRRVASPHTQWRFLSMVSIALCLASHQSYAADSLDGSASLTQAFQLLSGDRMMADIRVLAGPEFKGRQTGTPHDESSAEFVRRRFLQLRTDPTRGSEPVIPQDRFSDRSWLQSAAVRYNAIEQAPLLQLIMATGSPPVLIGNDYLPILDSPSADIKAPIVFVGYGISDPAGGIDEYAGMDVRNKVVLFLRGKPERYTKPVSHADKARTAQANGAIGLLTATGPILTAYESRRGITGKPSAFYGMLESEQTIPSAWISTALAAAMLNTPQSDGTDRLRTLQQHINQSLEPQSEPTNVTVTMRWASSQRDGTLHNVISVIPGRDPTHRQETIVIGAHRDHFGQQAGLMFPGADDNASGTAVLLEVARVLALSSTGFQRSILLVSFSGEEQGLLGSRFYVTHPGMPLSSTVAMLNVDHAGAGNGRFTVGVTGLGKTIAEQAGQKSGIGDHLDIFGFFPGGDHVPFKESGIPTITVVSGGIHPHFHQPTDTPDTVSPEILSAAARYVLALCWQLADAP